MHSKQIPGGIAQQAMLTAILELPLDRQVTALRGYIQRMKKTISARSVQTVPAAVKEKTAASISEFPVVHTGAHCAHQCTLRTHCAHCAHCQRAC